MVIEIPRDILSATQAAQLALFGSHLALPIEALLGDPITRAVAVTESDKRGLYFVHGIGSEPASVFTAVNQGLREDELIYGTPLLVRKTINGYVIQGINPNAAPEFFDGADSRNDQTSVYLNQVMYGTLHPIADNLQLLIIGAVYGNVSVSDQLTADFSSGTVQDTSGANITLPTTNNQAKGVLVQIDDAGALTYKQSSEYAATIQLPQAYRAGLLDEPDGSRQRVGYFRLSVGITEFSYADLWVVPEMLAGARRGFPTTIRGTYVISADLQQIAWNQVSILAGAQLKLSIGSQLVVLK